MNKRSFIARLGSVAAAALTIAAWPTPPALAQAPAAAPIHLIFAQTSVALGFSVDYVALDQGFYKKEGIDADIEIMNGGDPLVIAALHSGDAQFGAMTLVPALQAAARGEKLQVVAPLVREYVNEFVMNPDAAKKAGITDAMPLKEKFARAKGMTVGTLDIGGGLHLMFQGLVKDYGMDPQHDFNITAIKSYPALITAAKRNDIQIALTAIPFGVIGVQQDGLVMMADFWAGAVPQFDGIHHQGIVVNSDYATAHPDIVAKVNRAIDNTLVFMHEHPEEVVDDINKRFPNFSKDLLRIFYVKDKNSFAKRAIVTHKGFDLVRDFVSHSLVASAADVKYEKFVLPVAQEK